MIDHKHQMIIIFDLMGPFTHTLISFICILTLFIIFKLLVKFLFCIHLHFLSFFQQIPIFFHFFVINIQLFRELQIFGGYRILNSFEKF